MNFEKDSPEFIAGVQDRRARRMDTIDSQPPEIRELVHEYGWTVVDAIMRVGVKKPNHIKHIVETVLNKFSPTRGAGSCQGVKRAEGFKFDETPD